MNCVNREQWSVFHHQIFVLQWHQANVPLIATLSLHTGSPVILVHQYDWCVMRKEWLLLFQPGFLSQTETKVELWDDWEPFWEFKCFMALYSQNERLLSKKRVIGCTPLRSIMLVFTNLWPQILFCQPRRHMSCVINSLSYQSAK